MRGSVVPFCSTASLLFSFFLLLLSTTRHQFLRSVSTARKYAHVFTYTHLFPSRMKIFDSPCRRRKLTNGIVIRLEYHADDNYSRMRRWLQVLVNGIYSGKLTGIILGISRYFQDTRIFGEMCPPASFVDDNRSRSSYCTLDTNR